MSTKIKMCGFTRKQDVADAVIAGADALGFVLYSKSPRAVTIAQAATLIAQVPPFVTTVGLFVNPTVDEVNAAISQLRLDLLQFHGEEDASFCMQFSRPYIKAIAMGDAPNVADLDEAHPQAKGFLLDSHSTGGQGGSGKTFDWASIQGGLSKPLILAGGLDAENVQTAVKKLNPYAVDISSGIEREKGIKDAAKMVAFMQQVRSVT